MVYLLAQKSPLCGLSVGGALGQPSEMRRQAGLVVCGPQLRAHSAALDRSRRSTGGAACGAVGVVKLVGRICGVPVWLGGHETRSRAALRAMPISKSRNSGGVALRMRVLSLPPTKAIRPTRRAFA